ncbi:MAG: transglutaminase family protein [Sporichthyaceae bacterium]
MAIRVAIEHSTVYRFDRPTDLGPHTIRLRPAPHCRTPITGYSLTVGPADHFLNWQQDVYGNHAARLVFNEPATELAIQVDLVAEMTSLNPFDFFVEDSAEHFPFDYAPGVAEDLGPYLRPVDEPGAKVGSGAGPLLRRWLDAFDPDAAKGEVIVDFLVEINRRLALDVAYSLRMEPGVQSPDTTLKLGVGSCRDSAWLMVSILRELGLAARFVSGYLVQLVPDENPGTLTKDFTDLHAWAEVYVPGAGWIGLDPTSGLLAGEGHIPLVGSPRPEWAAPITGTTGPTTATMEFANVVRRIHEDPRISRPYSADQLARIDELGAEVDRRLLDGDVRLTMGGEPTFVAGEDKESEQWRTDADGPEKRAMATALAAKLKDHYAPAGATMYTQGKWYPGEPLPRWEIRLAWRADDVALWANAALLDDPWSEPRVEPGSEAASAIVGDLTAELAHRLGVENSCIRPLFEDPLEQLAVEARLPTGPAPDMPTKDVWPATGAARAAIVATLDAQRGLPQAWAIPLGRAEDGSGWITANWQTRRGELYLTPGTSPAGLRMPLDSIGWTPPKVLPEPSRFAKARPLPLPASLPDWSDPAPLHTMDDGAPRTALCVEERNGHVHVFLPPLPTADDFVMLLDVVARAAEAVGTAVVLEGYPPAGDNRMRTLTVTPDPGVIEVNVQPSKGWAELGELTRTLHAKATEVGLVTETFGIDGTHTGTGGGGHLTLGGAKPADSPLLRRPDLLVSMLTYWQHHPGLTYLFSGRFIGPTSQAPRVDEGRPENLYELEIAFAELAALETATPEGARPWQVDRALRHLLTDVTGNTHRSEFCIDKLFSPDSDRGRLGLLELRGFEMSPHPEMGLVTALLVRSLVARFWETPYTGKLIRWGTRLHDSFLLPEFALADVGDVVEDLRAHGLNFSPDWLDPFVEFRFPQLGATRVAGIDLELRAAIEPWHVLGEEATAGGTARYVDSSTERLQVKVTGAVPGRHVVTVNGVPLPLSATRGEALVAGVRYKAWAPPSALHPTIGVDSPLTFDVIDTWNNRSLGGCTYRVFHQGGRSWDTFPVNSAEAESRRTARFSADGHTSGPVDPSVWQASSMHPSPATSPLAAAAADVTEYPRTLDLRRFAAGGRRNGRPRR